MNPGTPAKPDPVQQLAHAIRKQVGQRVAALTGRVYDDTAAALDTQPIDLDSLKAELRAALREALQAEVDKRRRNLCQPRDSAPCPP